MRRLILVSIMLLVFAGSTFASTPISSEEELKNLFSTSPGSGNGIVMYMWDGAEAVLMDIGNGEILFTDYLIPLEILIDEAYVDTYELDRMIDMNGQVTEDVVVVSFGSVVETSVQTESDDTKDVKTSSSINSTSDESVTTSKETNEDSLNDIEPTPSETKDSEAIEETSSRQKENTQSVNPIILLLILILLVAGLFILKRKNKE